MISNPLLLTLSILILCAAALVLLPGCSVNGRPMRFDPNTGGGPTPTSKSWLVEGKARNNNAFSCSFVEFDERGDYIDFGQHRSCENKIEELTRSGRVLVVIYCHGWKNNSQSGDVVKFNAFLSRLADSDEVRTNGLCVHGVYLGWRGNLYRPYVEKSPKDEFYQETLKAFADQPIVDKAYNRRLRFSAVIPENLSYWSRKGAAEHLVSGLPMARAIFTYASAAKDYGKRMENRVFVIGHSFGALMLEKSLGQGMTGALTMEWWDSERKEKSEQKQQALRKPGLPFDLVLFVNSAAPAIYAKEMRDFLKAHRSALGIAHNPTQDVPVIVSITSTADGATGILHPIGNALAPFAPSLKRRYTTGILGEKQRDGAYPTHKPIRQSEFYTHTPGHDDYLINHWIVKDASIPPLDAPSAAVFSANLAPKSKDPDLFYTSKSKSPAAAWRISTQRPGGHLLIDGMKPAMQESDYWIISCGKELIADHGDVWSTTTMEMYAGIFRAVEVRRRSQISDAH